MEGRQLLAATLAVTTASGVPYAFTVGPGGAVTYQSDRPSNDPTHPMTPTGSIALPGLKAESIAAYTGADGLPTVVALSGPESFVYVNHFGPTGDAAEPLAWTGWETLGNFVATAISAADNATAGPAIFAVGADHALYEEQELASATSTAPAIRTGFDLIGGFNTAAVKAEADGNGFAVFALQGPESFVYEANTSDVPAQGGGGILAATAWHPVDNFVATAIDVSGGFGTSQTNPSGYSDVVLYALGGDDLIHTDHLVSDPSTGGLAGTGFNLVDDRIGAVDSFSVVVTPTVATIFVANVVDVVFATQVTTPALPNSWTPASFQPFENPSAIAATVGLGGVPGVYGVVSPSSSAVGSLLLDQAVSTNANGGSVFSGFESLATASSFAMTTAIGVAGLPVVFALGGDGSVSVDMDLAEGASGATDTYSGFSKLAGVSATSITATDEPDGIALFALTGSRSFVFEDQYRPTGNAVTPYAWTGWGQVGTFTASEIAAVLPSVPEQPITPEAGATGTPILIGLGATGLVYTLDSTAPAISTNPFTFGSPTPLPDLLPYTITARATLFGAEVFGQKGPHSDAYADLLLTSGSGASATLAWAGWQSLGDYVVDGIMAATGSGLVPALIAEDASGTEVLDEYRSSTVPTVWTGFQPIDFGSLDDLDAAAELTFPTSSGGAVFVLPAARNSVLESFQFIPDLAATAPPFEMFSGPMALDTTVGDQSFLPTAIAASPDVTALPSIFATRGDGLIYVNQAVLVRQSGVSYQWTRFVPLGPIPT